MPKAKHPAVTIKWREVESSNVRAVGWDNENGMYVFYKNGGLYLYKDVSRQRAVAAFRAPSVGEYLHREVISKFVATKIT